MDRPVAVVVFAVAFEAAVVVLSVSEAPLGLVVDVVVLDPQRGQ